METKEDLEKQVLVLGIRVDELYSQLHDGCTKAKFIEILDKIDEECKKIRVAVVRHSRRLKEGIRLDGQKDKRFKTNREYDESDSRFNT